MAPAPRERIDAFAAAGSSLEPPIEASTVAIGWATVELDRAVAELARAIGVPATAFVAADDDMLLGAQCRVASSVLAGGGSLVILEPATEGRLAATLARHDEGPVAIWMAVADLSGATAAARVANLALSPPRSGPLGLERLLLGGPIDGPHRLLLGPPGTIRP